MKNVRLRIPIATIAIAALALYLFGKWQATQGGEDARIIQSSRNALAAGKAYRARQAQLAAAAATHAASARTWQLKAQASAPAAAQLDRALEEAKTSADSNVVLTHQVAFYQGQALAWSTAYGELQLARAADSTRADRAEARIALLEQNLAATLTVADCRLLGVKFLPRCPSRNVAFVLGAGVTAIAFVATRH